MDLEMLWGNTTEFDLAVTDQGTALDLTGKTLQFMVKERLSDPDASALILKTSQPAGGITFTDAVNGLATITLDPADTNTFPMVPVDYFYDVQLVDGTTTITLVSGKLAIHPVVNR